MTKQELIDKWKKKLEGDREFLEGYEGDDIIGIVSKKFLDTETIIVTGDRDSFQLVDDVTKVYFTKKGTTCSFF